MAWCVVCYPDLVYKNIQCEVSKSILKLQYCRSRDKDIVVSISRFVTLWWIFICFSLFIYCFYMGHLTSTIVISHSQRLMLYSQKFPKAISYLFTLFFSFYYLHFIPLFMTIISSLLYYTYHEWLQFFLLTEYIRKNLWQTRNENEIFDKRHQRQIYSKLRKTIIWHGNILTYVLF